MALDGTQRGVLRNMLAALAITLILLGALVLRPQTFFAPPASLAERLALTLRWDALVLLCLVLSIGALARHRFFTPADIDGSGLTAGTDRAHLLQAVLQLREYADRMNIGTGTVVHQQAWSSAEIVADLRQHGFSDFLCDPGAVIASNKDIRYIERAPEQQTYCMCRKRG